MAARILIIEDNPANLELMRYLLSAFGHTVLTATDGRAGVEAALEHVPDLILCDVQLPVFDGFEVARQLKSSGSTRAVPLIAVTAFAMVGDREKVLSSGFDGYLAKPIEPENFASQVDALLQPQAPTEPRSASQVRPAEVASEIHNRTILVVDDNTLNLELAGMVLRHGGYDVVTARNMLDAIAFARQCHPSLILSDVNMANGSGLDLIARVKADEQLHHIPFLFISSTFVAGDDAARGLRAGALRYLTRPIEPEILLAEVNACLQGDS